MENVNKRGLSDCPYRRWESWWADLSAVCTKGGDWKLCEDAYSGGHFCEWIADVLEATNRGGF